MLTADCQCLKCRSLKNNRKCCCCCSVVCELRVTVTLKKKKENRDTSRGWYDRLTLQSSACALTTHNRWETRAPFFFANPGFMVVITWLQKAHHAVFSRDNHSANLVFVQYTIPVCIPVIKLPLKWKHWSRLHNTDTGYENLGRTSF